MRWWKPALLVSGLLIGGGIGLLVLLLSNPGLTRDRDMPAVGATISDFTLVDLAGETVQLSDYRGQVVVLNFWATWCPPCIEEMPLLEQYYQDNKDRLVVLAINYEEGRSLVEPFTADLSITFPVLLDEGGDVIRQYYVRSFPTTYFVDAEGVLRAQHIGQLSPTLIDRYLTKAGLAQ
ncbi:MAG TPA: TlpA disulfide reductase family protein [Anaerolineaceae bacterium]|nr:TlpA disulfide reductase family protein [Anaerolineaceae bacterium]